MTPSNLRDYLNQRLSQLSPHLLQTVVEFVEFLLHKQHYPGSTLKLIVQEQEASAIHLVQAIEQRFAPLGDFEIPLIPREPIRSTIDFSE